MSALACCREARALPVLQADLRRARIEAAVAFLKRRCVLVSVNDRRAQIRTYRVTGWAQSMLAEQVIEIAVKQGMCR